MSLMVIDVTTHNFPLKLNIYQDITNTHFSPLTQNLEIMKKSINVKIIYSSFHSKFKISKYSK